MYQQTIECNVIPEDLKFSDVTPLLNKGGRGQCSSYRHITLISVCCMVLETILKDNIKEHLECNKAMNDSQHGFRSGKLCAANLLTF